MKITIKGQAFDLSLEEIEALKKQLGNELPTTWEECNSIVKPLWLIDTDGTLFKSDEEDSKNQIPTEKHAKSVLAMCQLMTIAEALNRTCEKEEYTTEVYFDEGFYAYELEDKIYVGSPIQFNSKKLAEHAIKHFEQLWYDYFMIDKE